MTQKLAKDSDKYRLRELKIEVTSACSLACMHCSSDAICSGYRQMELSTAKRIVKQASGMDVREIAFSGGEPLLWPGIEDVLQLCNNLSIQSTVYTSGIIPDPDRSIGRLSVFNVQRIIFSLYASRPEIHDHITKKMGSWKRTLVSVKLARAAGLTVEFHFVPMRLNYTCLPDLAALASNLGVRQISVLRLVPQGRAGCSDGLLLSDSDNRNFQDLIENSRQRCRIRLGSPYGFLHLSDTPNCMAGVDRLTIAPDLRIYPCDAFKRIQAESIVGTDELSRLDRWSLSECWPHSPYLKLIRQHLQEPFDSPCLDCTYLPECKSGCPAQKYLSSGALSRRPDPMCLQATTT